MATTFIVIKENGLPVLRQAVRITKRHLVFSEPVDGETQIPKDRCYYFNAEYEGAYKRLKAISKKVLKYEKMKKELLDKELVLVTLKGTRF